MAVINFSSVEIDTPLYEKYGEEKDSKISHDSQTWNFHIDF